MRSWSTAVLPGTSLPPGRDAPAVTKSRYLPHDSQPGQHTPTATCVDALTHRHCRSGALFYVDAPVSYSHHELPGLKGLAPDRRT